MSDTTEWPTATTLCDDCGERIQWLDRRWTHLVGGVRHEPKPELRMCVDATCPACGWGELGYQPERAEFVCSRCEWTGTERPAR